MSIIPKITTEDVRLALNGTDNGSGSYVFWEQSITSGSVLAQINLANYYLYGVLGTSIMDSTDSIIHYHVNSCELAYACFRTLVILSGGVITDGFNFSAGISLQQPNVLLAWKNIISSFKDIAETHFKILQPMGIMADVAPLSLSTPASPMM
jgi:hypothetical protein